jgi:uncharacterized membrane protein HdeD (DUF308 family)
MEVPAVSNAVSDDVTERDLEGGLQAVTGLWWIFLVTGIAWLVIALLVLRFNETSVDTVGLILGLVFLGAAINEFVLFAVIRGGWRVFHLVLALVFVAGGIYCFVSPQDAFWELASILGLLLILMGAFQIVVAVLSRATNEVWWLGLIVGIIELLLGFWASQQYYPARAALILLWVGFFALFRGITEIVTAFQVRSVGKELAAGS